jgi:hypothetical protein
MLSQMAKRRRFLWRRRLAGGFLYPLRSSKAAGKMPARQETRAVRALSEFFD